MARLISLIIAASLLTGYSSSASDAWKQVQEEKNVTHVCGKVLCQDCSDGWQQWVNGAKPIRGCKVSLTCLDDRGRVFYYGSDLTDEAGDFDLIVHNYIHGKLVRTQNCLLRLVSSPDPGCNIPTDSAGGKTGVQLGPPTVVYRGLVKHVMGPFYYTTPMCDEPDTTTTTTTPRDETDEDSININY